MDDEEEQPTTSLLPTGRLDVGGILWDSRCEVHRVVASPETKEQQMSRMRAVAGVVVLGLVLVTSAPAAARSPGRESLRGTIVASGATGTRSVVSGLVAAKGVF